MANHRDMPVREMPFGVLGSFFHYLDEHYMFHSICRVCLQPIAINEKESGLRHGEAQHRCNDLSSRPAISREFPPNPTG
jgi:hypothetical protein